MIVAMSTTIAGLFTTPIMLNGRSHAALLPLLCLSIAIVYKTIRCRHVQDIPRAAFALWVTIVAAMYGVGVGLWLLALVFV